jgi:hypothetical protein
MNSTMPRAKLIPERDVLIAGSQLFGGPLFWGHKPGSKYPLVKNFANPDLPSKGFCHSHVKLPAVRPEGGVHPVVERILLRKLKAQSRPACGSQIPAVELGRRGGNTRDASEHHEPEPAADLAAGIPLGKLAWKRSW